VKALVPLVKGSRNCVCYVRVARARLSICIWPSASWCSRGVLFNRIPGIWNPVLLREVDHARMSST